MRAIPIRCPNCGASLNAAATALTITCAYCQTTSRIRPRTAFFEAPAPLPEAPPHIVNLPVALQQHSKRWAIGCATSVAFFVAIMVAMPLLIVHRAKSARGHNGVSGSTLFWMSRTPLTADVNGDGTADVLGRLKGLDGLNNVHLVAHDGVDGKPLWRSENLGEYKDLTQAKLVLAGDRLLLADPRGLVRSFAVSDGSASWKLRIDEALDKACRDDSGVYLVTADKRWIAVDLASGKATQAKPQTFCKPLQDDDRDAPTNVELIDRWNDKVPIWSDLDGMYVNASLGIETNTRLAIGYKSPGTSVPMVARYTVENFNPPANLELLEEPLDDLSDKEKRAMRDRQWKVETALRKAKSDATFKIVWKTAIPSRDPLAASSSRTEHYGISLAADCIAVPYEVRDQPIHVACISYKTGKHRWDIVLPRAFIDSLYGVAVTDKRVFVSVSSRVHVLDIATGKRLASIGQNNTRK